MEGQQLYDHILKQKLNQLEAPDMDAMWGEMHAMLDTKMPEKKKRRFFIWFFNRYMIMLLVLAVSSVTVSWYTFSQKSNSSETTIASKETITTQTTSSPEIINSNTVSANDKNTVNDKIAVNNNDKKAVSNNDKKVTGSTVVSNNDKKTGVENIVADKKEVPATINIIPESEKQNIQFRPYTAQTQKLNVAVKNPGTKLASGKSHVNIIPDIQASVNFIARKAITTAVSTNDTDNMKSTTSVNEVQSTEQNTTFKWNNTAATTIPAEINPFPTSNNVQMRMVSIDPLSLKIEPFKRKKQSYFVAGLAVNYHVPVSGQEMSTITAQGNQNRLLDYLPSVFTQYHLNEKWYVQAEFQYTSPQYIQPLKMASTFTPINANKKKEESISLSKLYYLNVPVSIHYKATKKMSVGAGMQYSYLRNSIIESEICTWENSNNSWSKTYEKKNVHVKSNPGQEKKNNANNPTTPLTRVDTLAQSLRSNDWRIVLDVNYKWRNLTGGARFNTGLNNYIDISSGGVTSALKDKNEAFQLYLRYDLFRSGRKRN